MDTKMEKKILNRLSPSQQRGSVGDSKKNSDLTQKPWPRNNKKREGSGSAPKNEPIRRNVPPSRGRGAGNRKPRPRCTAGVALGGAENAWLVEEETELDSVFETGSKKQNLNHLLNFMYSPRGEQQGSSRIAQPRRHNVMRMFHPHNHDLYLQASCQFVVKEDGDYTANLLDPDVPIKWEQIAEIVVRSSGRSECPICLGTPIAGRVGHCGHVHCYACALHYVASHERSPPPCPVCAAPFRIETMKPARVMFWKLPSDEVCMRLVRRKRGSNIIELAPERGEASITKETLILPIELVKEAPYAKLFSANIDQIKDIMNREEGELKEQILNEIDTTEIVYIEEALGKINKERLALLDHKIPQNDNPKEEKPPIVYEKPSDNIMKYDWFDVTEDTVSVPNTDTDDSDAQIAKLASGIDNSTLNPYASEFKVDNAESEEFPLVDEQVEETPKNIELINADKENQSKYFYFYQAEDGQQVFLDSINVRLLTSSWGMLAAAPLLIKGRVLRRETFSLNDQIRKHMPCTAHLPLHCPFDRVEVDLQPPHVTQAALNSFSDELDRRARNRARSEKEERRRERAHRRATEAPPRPDFTSQVLFPPTSPPNIGPSPLDPPLPTIEGSPPTSEVSSPPGLSFAKMASTSGTWRVRTTRPPTPPPPEEPTSGPRALNLSDAIEAALHAAPSSASKGRNKKAKQRVLFATGVQRTA